MEDVGQILERIHERNKRVEADKAWETSPVRIGAIASITYICAAALMLIIGAARPFASALIPVLGFLLSTLSLPPLKSWWLKQRE